MKLAEFNKRLQVDLRRLRLALCVVGGVKIEESVSGCFDRFPEPDCGSCSRLVGKFTWYGPIVF